MALGAFESALVTGACGGIGSRIVARLRDAGLSVHALSQRDAELREVAGATGAHPLVVDVGDAAAVTAAVSTLAPDILVNAAAILGPTSGYLDADPASAQALVNVNILGVENLLRAVVPGMVERNRGHVVNFGSVAGTWPTLGQPVYSATKAAVHLMTMNLRMELFGTDIRVSEIMPGRVQSGMHAEMFGGDHEKANALVYGDYECLQPEDVADAVLYMIGAPAHVNITQLEIMPTHQVLGGARYHSRSANAAGGQEKWR